MNIRFGDKTNTNEASSIAPDSLPAALYSAAPTPQRPLLYGNNAFTLLTGIPPQAGTSVSTPTLQELIHSADWPAVQTALEAAQRTQQPFQLEYRITRPGHPDRWILDQGQFCSENCSGLLIDITHKQIALQRASAHQQEAVQSEKLEAIGEVAGVIAHDFNNLLGGIMGATEILQQMITDDPGPIKFLDLVSKATAKAVVLTSKLLTFSRTQLSVKMPINLHQLIKETVPTLPALQGLPITVQLELNAEATEVTGDPELLKELFQQLCTNAAQAMPHGGQLSIDTSVTERTEQNGTHPGVSLPPGRYIQIRIQDSGCGIEEKNLPRVFQPFFTTHGKGQAKGLGLAMVYGTLRQHAGAIQLESQPGAGTTAELLLPLNTAAAPQAPSASTATAAAAKQKTILVIDDEIIMQMTAKAILESMDFHVEVAENGTEALALFQEKKETIDLVILDMKMPDMSGQECFTALQQIKPTVRVILSSGFTEESDLQAMRSAGLLGFIQKPFRAAILKEAISEALHG